MSGGHPEAAARFTADEPRTHWHDQALWFATPPRGSALTRGVASPISSRSSSGTPSRAARRSTGRRTRTSTTRSSTGSSPSAASGGS